MLGPFCRPHNVMLNLRRQNQRFETLIQNAVHGGAVYANFFSCSRKSWFREHALRMRLLRWPKKAGQIGVRAFSEVLNSGYCSELFMHVSTARELELESTYMYELHIVIAQYSQGPGPGARIFTWTGKAFIWRHLNVIICEFAFMLPQNQRFALITIVNAPFCAFWISVLKRRL